MSGTNLDDSLAEAAGQELDRLKGECVAAGYSGETRAALYRSFRSWVAHPVFRQYPGMLRCTVLNELQFTLSHGELRSQTWQLIGELVDCWDRESLGTLLGAIHVSSLECIAEAPERPADLKEMFALAAHPHARWAVLMAYENVPWRLRSHAHKYSNGTITDEDCDAWLIEQGRGDDEVLMMRTGGR